MRFKAILILFFVSLAGFCQQPVVKFNEENIHNVYQIMHPEKDRALLFITDSIETKAYIFSKNFELGQKLVCNKPNYKFKDVIGHSINGNIYTLFWATRKYKKIYFQTFNFDTKSIASFLYELDLKNETYVSSFSTNGYFYFLTKIKDSKQLKFYIFNEENKVTTRLVDLKDYTFESSKFMLVESNSPYSLVTGSSQWKIYPKGENVFFTFDNDVSFTSVLKVDLNNFETKPYVFKRSFGGNTKPFPSSNSILADDKIIQLETTDQMLSIAVKNFNDGSLVKEYRVNADENIKFKNSDIIRMNSISSSERVLERTSQFLSKINDLNVGLVCVPTDSYLKLTIGGVSEIRSSGVGVGVGFGAPMMVSSVSMSGGIPSISTSFQPTFSYFNYYNGDTGAYTNRRVVYINALFDKDFNHVAGEIPKSKYDQINEFIDGHADFSDFIIIPFGEQMALGYYNNASKQYELLKY